MALKYLIKYYYSLISILYFQNRKHLDAGETNLLLKTADIPRGWTVLYFTLRHGQRAGNPKLYRKSVYFGSLLIFDKFVS